MSKKFLVIGSGLSALGSIKALNKEGIVPDVYDTSFEIEENIKDIKERLKNSNQRDWKESDIKSILLNFDKNEKIFSIPKKTLFSSSFFYGESQAKDDINSEGILPPFSYALGGLAEGWGAAFLPPAKEDLKKWVYSYEHIYENFKEILKYMHVTGEKDDLEKVFPIMKDDAHSLKYSNESLDLLKKLQKYNKNSNILIGKSRLLLNPMEEKFTPFFPDSSISERQFNHLDTQRIEMQRDWYWQIHDAIYKPSLDIKLLSKEGRINLYPGRRVTDVVTNPDKTLNVNFISSSGKKLSTTSFQKVFLAAGCVNTSRIILNSKKFFDKKLKVKTRGGFLLPAFSSKSINPSLKIKNTMPDFFIEIFNKFFPNWIHIQVSLQNELFENRLNSIKNKIPFRGFINSIKQRAFIVFVNLSSDQAGHYELHLDSNHMSSFGPRLDTTYVKKAINPIKKFNLIFQIFLTFAKAKVFVSPFGKSNAGTYHVGGSFPMKKKPLKWNETNQLGELKDMKNLHLVDSSTFPTLPGTTIGLLSKVMAYCVTKEVLKDNL
jgi:hypothetical protein